MLESPSIRRSLRLHRPQTANHLHGYVRSVLGFVMPRHAIVEGHTAPFAYLVHAFFEHHLPRDCVVWANRGGGKTQLGAIATLLDMLFKPGIQIRILGGSFEQSDKMYRYLRQMIESDTFIDLVDGNVTGRAFQLQNGSRVEVLSQSQRAVRGQRIHKLRCDEVELFDPDVWEAAQLVTRSGWCGDTFVRASIETLSTMHRPYGLMQQLVQQATSANRRVFRWSVLDTLSRCEPQRPCETCSLWNDCQGRAKSARGFIDIDDAIQQQTRIGVGTWRSEMLCAQPSRDHQVYPEFDRDTHVAAFDVDDDTPGLWLGGMDFGYRDPTVLLWAHRDEHDVLRICDELVLKTHTTEAVIQAATQRRWPRPKWLAADPAGHQRNDQTGLSAIQVWRRAGWSVRTRGTTIEAGVLAVRRRLLAADGRIRLFVHPRCAHLIEALTMYHYPPDRPGCDTPVKDGHDHAADALRYLVVNIQAMRHGLRVRQY